VFLLASAVTELAARNCGGPFFLRRSQQTARSCRDIIGHILGSAGGYVPPDPAKFSSLPRTWAGRETTCAFRSLVALQQSQLLPPQLPVPIGILLIAVHTKCDGSRNWGEGRAYFFLMSSLLSH
jgi:hypothetical protein